MGRGPQKKSVTDATKLNGAEKAAVVLLSLGEEHHALWQALDDEEIKEISQAMSTLGTVSSQVVEDLMVEFVSGMSSAGAIMGSFEQTQKLLSALPEDFALECVMRMLRMEPVQREILDKIEQTLRTEFMSNLARTSKRDSHEMMAEIFNSFDRQTESRFIAALEERNRESAERIRALMFVFEDLSKLDPGGVQTLLRAVEKDQLGLALKGASDSLREMFFSNMSERAAKIMREDMESMGPVRLRDVDAAQMAMVQVAKDLAAKGEIMLAGQGGDDELIY